MTTYGITATQIYRCEFNRVSLNVFHGSRNRVVSPARFQSVHTRTFVSTPCRLGSLKSICFGKTGWKCSSLRVGRWSHNPYPMVLILAVLRRAYSGISKSIPWLQILTNCIARSFEAVQHGLPFRVNGRVSPKKEDFNCLCEFSFERLYKRQIIYLSFLA